MKDNKPPTKEELTIKPCKKLKGIRDEKFQKILKQRLIQCKPALDYLRDK